MCGSTSASWNIRNRTILFFPGASFQTASSDNTLWLHWKSRNQRSLSPPPEGQPSNLESHPLCTPPLFRSWDHSSRGTKRRRNATMISHYGPLRWYTDNLEKEGWMFTPSITHSVPANMAPIMPKFFAELNDREPISLKPRRNCSRMGKVASCWPCGVSGVS